MTQCTYEIEFGIWWPASTRQAAIDIRHVLNQLPNLRYAVGLCKKRRVVVQAGGHAGLFPRELAKLFDRVYTFEPNPASWMALVRNTEDLTNVRRYNGALASVAGTKLQIRLTDNAAATRIDPNGTLTVDAYSIDGMSLKTVDLIVLDVEGYEDEVLQGAKATIARNRPIIQVELLVRSRDAIIARLTKYGYVFDRMVGKDAVFRHGA